MRLAGRLLAASLLALVSVQPALAGDEGAGTPSLMGPGLRVADLEVARPFYTEGLGLTEVRRLSLSEGREEIILSFGEAAQPPFVFLIGPLEAGSNSRTVIAYRDIEAVHARLEALGYAPGELTGHADSGTRLFWVTDPDGNGFEIIQLSPRDAERAGGSDAH